MNYERINWENAPSTDTPLDADNLNKMDEALDTLNREIASARTHLADLEEQADLLSTQIAGIIRLEDGSTTGDAELINGRIGYDNTSYDTIGEAIRTQSGNLASVLNRYKSTTPYNLGDYVSHNGYVYRCIATGAFGVPTPPDSDYWELMGSLNTVLREAFGIIAPLFQGRGESYAVGDYCIYDGTLYRCATAHTAILDFDSTKWDEIDGGVTEELNSKFSELNERLGAMDSDLTDTINLVGIELLTDDIEWEVGSLNVTDGSNLTSTTRIRTVGYIDISTLTSLTFDVDEGYKYVVDWYDSNKTLKKVTIATAWQTTDQIVVIPNDVAYMRLLISANPDATANVSFAEHLSCRGENALIGNVNRFISNEPSYLQATNVRVTSTNILSDMDNAEPNKIYNISNVLQNISNIPSDLPSGIINGTMWVVCGEVSDTSNWRVQFLVTASKDPIIYYRNKSSNTWKSWQKISTSDTTSCVQATNIRVTATSILSDLDNAEPNRIYNISAVLQSISNIPTDTSAVNATVWTLCGEMTATTNWRVQFLVTADSVGSLYIRHRTNSTWQSWKKIAVANPSDANLLSLDYYNATAVNKLEVGSIQNKNVLTFGDSITAGNTDTSWTYHFANMTGSTIVNKAVAGASFGESTAESSNKYISTQIAGVSSSEWESADIVIVSAGTNDGLINTPRSELEEKVLSAITAIKAETNAPIVFITPIRRNTPTYSENLKLPLISGIISNVALMNECNVICGYTFPIPSETIDEITNVTRDGLHPNAIGANIYARSVINALT